MSPAVPRAIAIDVGGTGIKAALIDAHAGVHHQLWRPTARERGPEAVIRTITDLATELAEAARRAGAPAHAIGLALPGIVDEAAGTVLYSATIGWRDIPFGDLIAKATGLPVAITHDVRAGGIAEARLGAGRGHRRFLFVPIGTSIAAAIMTDATPEPGAHHRAGEIGHLTIRPGGDQCACGARGCAETYASATAISRRYAMTTGHSADAAEVAARSAAGEEAARRVWEQAIDALADTLLQTMTIIDPPLIVLGGGVAESGELLLSPLRAAMASKAVVAAVPVLAQAELGDRAGCLGAGLAALDLITVRSDRGGRVR
ncbi:ROK family protein [Kitasatospora sp. NPDC057015]|uniref:ROK family protein n=1 Tax=Kitasatospora sp. NPDC057015 TaxID=3346001 RepID=UPI00362B14F9